MATATVQLTTPKPAPPREIESVTLVMTKAEALGLLTFIDGEDGPSGWLRERRVAAGEVGIYNVNAALGDALGPVWRP